MIKRLKELYDSDPKYGQFLRFCINGVLAVGIQYAVYLVCIQWMDEFVANTIGYFVSFCCNFIITSYWTFRSRPSWKKLTGFGLSAFCISFIQRENRCSYDFDTVPVARASNCAHQCQVYYRAVSEQL